MSKACGGAGRKKVSGLSGAARLSQKGSRRKRSNGAPAMAQQDLDAGDHCDCCGGAIAADDDRAMSITDEELLRTMKRRRLLAQHVRASHPEILDTEKGRAWLWSMDTITDTQAQQQKQAREQAAMAPEQEDRDPVDRHRPDVAASRHRGRAVARRPSVLGERGAARFVTLYADTLTPL